MSRINALEALVGLTLITTGVAMWSVPAAFIVAGMVVFGFAVGPLIRRP